MNPSKRTKTTESSSTMEISIITLIPCDYDSSEEEDEKSVNVSKDSMDSSEILDSSDDEIEIIKINEIIKPNKEPNLIQNIKVKRNDNIVA